MSIPPVRVTVDTSEVPPKVEEAERTAAAAAAAIATGLRRTLQFGTLALQAFGVAINEAYRVAIEAVALSAEVVTGLIAGSVTPATAALRIAQVSLLLMQLAALKRGRTEAAMRLGAAEQALTMVSF